MHFPLEIPLGRYSLNAHMLFESLAYFIAFRVYLHERWRGDFLSETRRLSAIAAVFMLSAACAGISANIGRR